jgi:general secretion pathway protein M
MNAGEQLRARWAALEMRERRLVAIAAVLVALALLWWIGLAPALRTLTAAGTEHARLDAQLQQMASLQARARALQAQPRLTRDDALRALDTSVRQSLGGNAQLMTASGDGAATITLRAAPADAVAQWLTQARGNAHAVPREAHLTRAAAAPPAAGKNEPGAPAVRWEGTFVMALPAAR